MVLFRWFFRCCCFSHFHCAKTIYVLHSFFLRESWLAFRQTNLSASVMLYGTVYLQNPHKTHLMCCPARKKPIFWATKKINKRFELEKKNWNPENLQHHRKAKRFWCCFCTIHSFEMEKFRNEYERFPVIWIMRKSNEFDEKRKKRTNIHLINERGTAKKGVWGENTIEIKKCTHGIQPHHTHIAIVNFWRTCNR